DDARATSGRGTSWPPPSPGSASCATTSWRRPEVAARTDRTTDPGLRAALLLARRGQAYFSRKLNELRKDELDAPSLVPGWTRRHVVAQVGYNARALTRLTEWAATGVE